MATEKINLNDIDTLGTTQTSLIQTPFKVTVSGIDGLATGKTTLLTVPTGKTFIITGANVRLTSVTGVATAGVVKIINDTAGVDLIANTTLTGLTAVTKFFPLLLTSAVSNVAVASDVIRLEITTAFTVATVVTLSADLVGYLV